MVTAALQAPCSASQERFARAPMIGRGPSPRYSYRSIGPRSSSSLVYSHAAVRLLNWIA